MDWWRQGLCSGPEITINQVEKEARSSNCLGTAIRSNASGARLDVDCTTTSPHDPCTQSLHDRASGGRHFLRTTVIIAGLLYREYTTEVVLRP